MNQTNGYGTNKNGSYKPPQKPQKNQVSLAGVAQNSEKKEQKKEKGRFPVGKVIALSMVLIILVLAGILLYRFVSEFWSGTQEKKPALTAREMVEYTSTPDDLAADVSYYLMGVTGAEIGDSMDMLAVMCYDRKADAVSVVQIPVDTYIDKENGFAVDTIGDVWYNPQPLVFCSSCREQVPEEERDGEIHATCGANLEEHNGSATGDLIRIINEQYGLPIDNYFFVSREGFANLIDGFGGVQVEMKKDVTLGERVYSSGVHNLDGHTAVEYAITYNYKGTPASDRERMIRQRQVLASLWSNMASYTEKELYYVDDLGATKGILGRLMVGKTPIRFNSTSFGPARMLGLTDKEAESIENYEALSRFVVQLGEIPLDQVTFSILPGESEAQGTTKVYSVNRAQVIELLNQQMNPYELTIDDTTVTAPQVTEVANEVEFVTETLDSQLAENEITPEEEEE